MNQKQLSSNLKRNPNLFQRRTFSAAGRRLLSGAALLALILALAGVLTPAQLVHAAGPFTVNTTADTHDANPGDGACQDSGGQCSLRAAVEQATASGGATTINLPSGTYTLSQALGELQLGSAPGSNITLTGANPANTIISEGAGPSPSRIFDIDFQLNGGVTVSISNVTIQNGVGGDGGGGGGILDGDVGDVLNLTNVVFNNNTTSSFDGGAISFTGGGTLNVQNSVFTNNTSPTGNGGAIHFVQTEAGAFTVNNSTFTNNSASGGALGGQGGAINLGCTVCAPLTITNSTFSGNSAVPNGASGGQGGAIMLGAGVSTINFNRFINNTASRGGSGIFNGGGTATATKNWWGCSAGPGSAGCDSATNGSGTLTTAPRIVLSLNASPASILINQTSALTADFLHDSSGGALTAANVSTLIGLPVTWAADSNYGSLSGQQLTIQANGTATATFTSNGTPTASTSVSAQVDNGATTTSIAINQPPAITSADNTTFTIGVAGSFTVSVTGFPIPGVSESGSLPGGVGFADNHNRTATLSGMPAFGSAGSYPLTITAANGFGSDAVQSFTLTVIKANTTTTLTAAPNPSVFGQTVTFTATVAPQGAGTPSGTVTFFDGATNLGTGTLGGGMASLTTSSLAVATHLISAVYAGDTSFNGSTSSSVSQVVNLPSTTTTLVAAPNPSVFGQTVTLTATVTVVPPGAGTPDGSVTFFDGATSLGAGTLSGGVATLSSSTLSTGSHSFTAVYGGSASFNGSTSSVFTQTVSQAATTTSLVSAPNPSVFGQTVTLTATVAAVAPGAGTPSGSVSFFDGATLLGSATLDGGGAAAFSTSVLPAVSHSLTAVYAGDTNFGGSTSTISTQVVSQAATTTSLAVAPNPSVFGQTVTLTATVAVVPPGAGTPGGTVSFFDGATLLGGVTLNGSGQASLSTSSLSSGPHNLTAVYGGDTNFAGSTSAPVSQVVSQADTTTSLVGAPNPSLFGQSVTFTATVTASAPGAGTPSGTVTFFDGATNLGTGTLSAGVATFSTSSLAVATHSITASYGGDASFNASTSSAVSQVVNLPSTTTTLVAAPNPSVFGQAVTLTATVSVVPPGTGTPTGTVTFFEGANSLGTGALSGGVATLSSSTFSVGTHSALTAVYAGDTSFGGSTSAPITQTVTQASSITTLVSAPNPSVFGQTVTLTATVAAVSPGAGTPGGTVTFFDGASSLGTGTLSAGVASLSTSVLSAATHALTAVYAGDTNFTGSTSSAVSQVVNAADTATALAASDGTSIYGYPVTLTATVTAVAPGGGIPTGSVTFRDGSTVLGVVNLNASGVAVFTTSTLARGSRSITAEYTPGTTAYNASTQTKTVLVKWRYVFTLIFK